MPGHPDDACLPLLVHRQTVPGQEPLLEIERDRHGKRASVQVLDLGVGVDRPEDLGEGILRPLAFAIATAALFGIRPIAIRRTILDCLDRRTRPLLGRTTLPRPGDPPRRPAP